MLIRFTVENFLSFRDRQVFSLLPGKGTLKRQHKSKPVKGTSVLKTAVVYGANASGKSNLIKAIEFGRKLVLKGTKTEQPITFDIFKLPSPPTPQGVPMSPPSGMPPMAALCVVDQDGLSEMPVMAR